MPADLESTKNFLLHYKAFLYIFTFIVSFAESFAIVGLIVPGAVIIATAGIVCAKTSMSFLTLIIWCSAGAVLGDIASYYAGVYLYEKVKASGFYSKYRRYFLTGEIFFKKYGGISVFIGRFVGVLRPVIPFIAGVNRMNVKKFYIYAVLSGVLWGISYPGVGFMFGEAWRQIQSTSTKIILLISCICFLILTFTAFKRRRRGFRKGESSDYP